MNQQLAAEPVSQIAEKGRAGHGAAGEIRAGRQADLRRGEPQAGALLQSASDSAGDGDFEPVEDPGDAKRHDDEPVEPASRWPVQTRRYIADDRPVERLRPDRQGASIRTATLATEARS